MKKLMRNEILVSVIVPIYNVEKYLNRCLKSIVEQDYKKLEIILIDDGSQDSSGQIADKWSRQDFRIKVIHKKNGGLSAARNTGIDMATGEYYLFVDSDDWIHKHMITALISKIQKGDLVCCGMLEATDDSVIPMKWFKKEHIFSSTELLDYVVDNTIFTSHVQKILYPKYVFEKVRFPEGKIFEDIRILHKIVIEVKNICIIPEAYYYYYVRNDSISNIVKLNNRIEWFKALRDRANDLKGYKEEYQKKIQAQMAIVISLAIVQNKFSKQEKALNKKELREIRDFLMENNTKNAVKLYASYSQYCYYKLTRMFWLNANRGYGLIKRIICLKKEILRR